MFKLHDVKSLYILFVILTSIALTVAPSQIKLEHLIRTSATPNIHPYESFAKISVDANLKFLICESGDCPEGPIEVPIGNFSIMGSGAAVGTDGAHTYVITAAHVCVPEKYMNAPSEFEGQITKLETIITISGFYGGVYTASIIEVDEISDLCLLRTEGVWATPVPLAREMPIHGAVVYNVAAPRGIYHAGMVPLFTGYYSGTGYGSNVYFSLPTAPGSSGSIVLNERGEIISIIHSSIRGFDNVGIGANIDSIWALINNADIPAGTIY
jgi:S1-C subfamily serine protease